MLALIAPQDEVQALGTTLWRIGQPGLYVSAPQRLKAAPVEWAQTSGWLAESADLRVVIVSVDLGRITDLTQALGEKAGGTLREVKVSGYPASRWGSGDNQALLIQSPRRAWAIWAKGKSESVTKTIESAMLDRTDAPHWQDRNLGKTSLQATIPFSTEDLLEEKSDSNTQELAWDGVRVVCTEIRTGADFDKTVELHVSDLKAQGASTIERLPFAAGYLVSKGVRITATVGTERINKVIAVVGTRLALIAIHLKVGEPRHLAIERRLLDSLRVGWTTFDEYESQNIETESLTFSAPITFNPGADNDVLRMYGSGGWLLYSLDSKGSVPDWTKEGKDLNAIVGQLVTGAGGNWTGGRDRLVGFGPFLGALATGQGTGARGTVFTSAASMFTSRRGYLWIYMTETVSFDVMEHVTDTVRFALPLPAGWARIGLGPVAIGLPDATPRGGTPSSPRWQAEKDGVRVTVELLDLPKNGDATTLMPPGGFRARTQLDRGFGWVQQVVINEGPYRLADTLTLVLGARVARITVAWTPSQPASGSTRDAVLASISTP